MTFEHSSSSLGHQCQMVSAENNTSGPVPQCSKRRLIAADQASVFMEMTSVHISSGLVLHQMTSDHNRSELGIHDHSNELSSSKLVPKVVPLAVKTATSRQELELLFHHHIAMLRTTSESHVDLLTLKMTHGPSDVNAHPSQPFPGFLSTETCLICPEIHTLSIDISSPRLIKPTIIGKALSDSSWVEAMQEELLQFNLQQVWILVDLPNEKKAIGTKWVYVDDIIFGSTNKELCTGFEKLMKDKFHMSAMGELTFFLGLQVQQKEDDIFISQDKYVAEILKKFNYSDVKSASTPVDLEKPLVKDEDADDVDVHLYRSMIGSLMYLTASRPDIMFAYSRDSPFELVAYTDSDYAGATLDMKSTTRRCQFLGNRLISWQCKKQTVVATYTTEAEYMAAAICCGQVLWIQNQLLDYGYNFMNTVINIDNNSTICIIENPVQHSKTKHIEIRHHFIRDCKENLHITFLENKPNVAGSGPEWLFDIDSLTKSMNYELVTAGNQTNGDAGIETNANVGQAGQEKLSDHEYILLPLMLSNCPLSSSSQSANNKDADELLGDDNLNERNG
ncbi:putative ribonuclease H-like domain-containing protein [Tanacetum coccineum]